MDLKDFVNDAVVEESAVEWLAPGGQQVLKGRVPAPVLQGRRLPLPCQGGTASTEICIISAPKFSWLLYFKHSLDYIVEMEEDRGGYVSDMAEEPEVRMELTDDLLHMVFSFLGHTDLCRAALVCRQWRAASAHEDFWRCFNF